MRVTIFSLVIFSLVCCCSKLDKKLDDKYDCNKLSGVHKFIYEPIVISDNCNCIVSGKVKYLKDCNLAINSFMDTLNCSIGSILMAFCA